MRIGKAPRPFDGKWGDAFDSTIHSDPIGRERGAASLPSARSTSYKRASVAATPAHLGPLEDGVHPVPQGQGRRSAPRVHLLQLPCYVAGEVPREPRARVD